MAEPNRYLADLVVAWPLHCIRNVKLLASHWKLKIVFRHFGESKESVHVDGWRRRNGGSCVIGITVVVAIVDAAIAVADAVASTSTIADAVTDAVTLGIFQESVLLGPPLHQHVDDTKPIGGELGRERHWCRRHWMTRECYASIAFLKSSIFYHIWKLSRPICICHL